jgi:hypothetical protein
MPIAGKCLNNFKHITKNAATDIIFVMNGMNFQIAVFFII